MTTALQQLFGQPKIALKFASIESDGAVYLQAHISNQPLRNRFLIWSGVYRRPVTIMADATFLEADSGRQIFPVTRLNLRLNDEERLQALLAPPLPAVTSLVAADQRGAYIYEAGEECEAAAIQPGRYTIVLHTWFAEGSAYWRRDFQVGVKPADTLWLDG